MSFHKKGYFFSTSEHLNNSRETEHQSKFQVLTYKSILILDQVLLAKENVNHQACGAAVCESSKETSQTC